MVNYTAGMETDAKPADPPAKPKLLAAAIDLLEDAYEGMSDSDPFKPVLKQQIVDAKVRLHGAA